MAWLFGAVGPAVVAARSSRRRRPPPATSSPPATPTTRPAIGLAGRHLQAEPPERPTCTVATPSQFFEQRRRPPEPVGFTQFIVAHDRNRRPLTLKNRSAN